MQNKDLNITNQGCSKIVQYLFQLHWKLQLKHTQEIDKNECANVTLREFVFSPLGNLMIYRENQRDISAYNRYQELSGNLQLLIWHYI